MTSGIFLIKGGDDLTELTPTAYDSEAVLQRLLAKFPSLIPGAQLDPESPRRWLLVSRETGVPGTDQGGARWYVDHLLLDQDGIPTLIEVKRSTDTRIRREVVGQMLDYAANAVVNWRLEAIQERLALRCSAEGMSLDDLLVNLLGPGPDVAGFWEKVKTNLQAGRIRMVFVADEIPRELARVVEFLNEQMDPAEVLAVEIRQFAGPGVQSLIPRVIGLTEQSEQRKGGAGASVGAWTETSFFAKLSEKQGTDVAGIVRDIVRWAAGQGARFSLGRGAVDGSLYPIWDRVGEWYCPVVFYTYGAAEVQFQYLKQRPPFDREDVRRDMLLRLNRIPGADIPETKLAMRPSFRLDLLKTPAGLEAFQEALAWFLRQLPSTQS